MKSTSAASATRPARFFFRMLAAMLCAVFCLRVTPLHADDVKPGSAWNLGMNVDWKFSKAKGVTFPLADALKGMAKDGKQFYDVDYDDSDWQTVSLPHAVNADDSFDSLIADAGEQDLYRGFMFYRKKFRPISHENEKKKFFLEFESVRQTIYLYVNGQFAGYYEAGVAPTGFDITPWIRPGENLIAVATDNTASRGMTSYVRETRPGHTPGDNSGEGFQWNQKDFNPVQGGITGNVYLHEKPDIYFTLPLYNNLKTVGTYITASDFDFEEKSAVITVRAEVRNESGAAADLRVNCMINHPVHGLLGLVRESFSSEPVRVPAAKDAGKVFPTAVESEAYDRAPAPTGVRSPETTIIEFKQKVTGLKFWSPETPDLYDIRLWLWNGDELLEEYWLRTGFRKVEYDRARGGLLINGRPYYLKGYAQRSTDEWAAIGVANQWLHDFDAALVRESGANYIRWMHVAPKPAAIRSGDKYGIVSVCPAGDKEKDIAGRAWNQRVEAMRDAIVYFRNSPSVLFWEAGNNEITPAHMREMTALKRRLDPDGGRFMGCRTISSPEQVAEAEWVGTMIYRHGAKALESMKALNKYLPVLETEYKRDESPRRAWDRYSPPDYDYVNKWLGPGAKKTDGYDVWDATQEDLSRTLCDRIDGYSYFYDNRVGGTGANCYVGAAMMVWSDSNMHGRNAGSENCRTSGRVDPVRIPKGTFYAVQVYHSEVPKVKIVGHWNYPALTDTNYFYQERKNDGTYMKPTGNLLRRDPTKKTVYAVAAKCDKVELVVNGKKVSECTKPRDGFVYDFPNIDVTQSGVVEAVAWANGRIVARDRIESAGPAAGIRLTPVTGPSGFFADGADIAFFDVAVVDDKGRVCPCDSRRIDFTLEGPGVFLGGYNSGKFGKESVIHKNYVFAECGVNRVFVRATREKGKITLKARSAAIDTPDMKSPAFEAEATIEARAADLSDGGFGSYNDEIPPGRFKPVEYVAASGSGPAPVLDDPNARPCAVYVGSKPVEFPTYCKPFRPDSATGVVCPILTVLDELIKQGVPVSYKMIFGRESPIPQLKYARGRIYVVKAGERTLYLAEGFTEIFLDDGSESSLTNFEFEVRSLEFIGELSAVLAFLPVKTDFAENVVYITP